MQIAVLAGLEEELQGIEASSWLHFEAESPTDGFMCEDEDDELARMKTFLSLSPTAGERKGKSDFT